MPKLTGEAALQGSGLARTAQGALNRGWLAGGLGQPLSGIMASNGKPMENYGLTLEKIKKIVSEVKPPPFSQKFTIPVYEPRNYAADFATGESVSVATNINYVTVDLPLVTTGTASQTVTYQWPNLENAFANQLVTSSQAYINQLMTYQLGSVYPSYGTTTVITAAMTPAEREAWVKAEAEKAEKKAYASKRAEGLLFTILKPEQVRQYEKDGYFETEVDDRIYRIHKRSHSGNVELIVNGKAVAKFCAHPSNCYETPVQDTMLSQFLMLKADEARFLKTANRTQLM